MEMQRLIRPYKFNEHAKISWEIPEGNNVWNPAFEADLTNGYWENVENL